MERAQRVLYRLAMGSAVAGLAVLGVVMLSGKAWPHPLYAVGAPVGMGFIALCLVFLAARWMLRFAGAVRTRQLWQVVGLILAAVICLLGFLRR